MEQQEGLGEKVEPAVEGWTSGPGVCTWQGRRAALGSCVTVTSESQNLKAEGAEVKSWDGQGLAISGHLGFMGWPAHRAPRPQHQSLGEPGLGSIPV
jgi:hypothetical protein